MEKVGANITRGVEVPALDREKKWDFTAVVTPATKVEGGDVIGTVPETPVVLHKIMVPPNMSGTITDIQPRLLHRGGDRGHPAVTKGRTCP